MWDTNSWSVTSWDGWYNWIVSTEPAIHIRGILIQLEKNYHTISSSINDIFIRK
jgi:hypothetical protein